MNININTDENGLVLNIEGVELRIPQNTTIPAPTEVAAPVKKMVKPEKKTENITKKIKKELIGDPEPVSSSGDEYTDYYQKIYMDSLKSGLKDSGKSTSLTELRKLKTKESIASSVLFKNALDEFNADHRPKIVEEVTEKINKEFKNINSLKFDNDTLNGKNICDFIENPSASYLEPKACSASGTVTTKILNTTAQVAIYSWSTKNGLKVTLNKNFESWRIRIYSEIQKSSKILPEATNMKEQVEAAFDRAVINKAVAKTDKRVLSPSKSKPLLDTYQELREQLDIIEKELKNQDSVQPEEKKPFDPTKFLGKADKSSKE